MPQANADTVRALIASYLAQDRAAAEGLVAEQFVFTSPQDDHIEAALRERFEQEEGYQAMDPERFELLNSYESNAAGLLRWIQQRQRASGDG